MPKLPKIISKASQVHDVSTLLRAFVDTIVTNDVKPEIFEQVKKILKAKDMINLKAQFLIVSSILNHLLEVSE